MAKKTALENAIAAAAERFAGQIIDAVKGATLQELLALQAEGPISTPAPKRGPGRPPKSATPPLGAKPTQRKKRKPMNYPKCAFPGCGKNRFPRGKGFCGEHFNRYQAGEIKSAAEYKQPSDKQAKSEAKTAQRTPAKRTAIGRGVIKRRPRKKG